MKVSGTKMIKVVGQDQTVAKRITCRACGGINEYTPNDVKQISYGRDLTVVSAEK